jgi:HEAT repeat protein
MATNGEEPTCQGRPAGYWIAALVYDAMRQQATEVLCAAGTAAIPALVKALRDPNNRVREEAARVLKRIDPTGSSDQGARS